MKRSQIKEREKLVGNRYFINEKEKELEMIEADLEKALGCFVRCAYDCVWSHKHKEEDRENIDYIINYELYKTPEDKATCANGNGGFDGEVHELFYLKGNGEYIVITEV